MVMPWVLLLPVLLVGVVAQQPPTTCRLAAQGTPSAVSLACSGDQPITVAAHSSIASTLKKSAKGPILWDRNGCDNLGCLITICGASSMTLHDAQVLGIRDQRLTAALCIGGTTTLLLQAGTFSGISTGQGAVLVLGKARVRLQGTRITNNTGNSTLGGLSMGAGLVVQEGARVHIMHSAFTGNLAAGTLAATGAAVVVQDHAAVVIEDSVFDGNTAAAEGVGVGFAGGAAIYAEGDAAVTARRVRFVNNTAAGAVASAAGAVCLMHNVSLSLTDGVFEHNTARSLHAFGGALAAMNSTAVDITNTTFSFNTAHGTAGIASGAGILLGNSAHIRMTGGRLVGNFVNGSLVGAGGAACVFDNATLLMHGVLVSGNKAVSASSKLGALGGGLSCLNTSRCWLEACTVIDNTANCTTAPAAGGGLGAYDKASVRLARCNVSRNWVKGAQYASGGGLFAQSAGSLLLAADSLFDANSALVYELSGGYAGGGAVGVNGSAGLHLTRCNFSRNSVAGVAATGGGAVHVNGSVHVTVQSCQFVGNSLAGLPGWNVPSLISCGGALGVQGPSVMAINGSLFHDNSVDGMRVCGGSACAMWGGKLRVHASRFVANHAAGASLSCGGGVCAIDNGTLHVTHATFERNRASGSVSNGGGACATTSSKATVADSIFQHNAAGWAGGAVGVSDGCTAAIRGCSFRNNTASNTETGCGGAVSVGFEAGGRPASCSIEQCSFVRNSALGQRGSGGAVYTNNAVLKVADSGFAGNAAQQGGALGGSGVSWDLSNTTFDNHTVAGPGGAILLSGGLDTTLSGCSISHNRWAASCRPACLSCPI